MFSYYNADAGPLFLMGARVHRLVKPVIFAASLVPALWLVYGIVEGTLGANPAEAVQLETGIWAFRFLIASLAVTPIRRLTGANRLVQYRRMLGLFAFFYACLHLLSYVAFDQLFAIATIPGDVYDRPFIAAGMAAFLLLVPLAITSTRGWIRRLGRRWQRLHRLVYLAAIAASLHFVWKVKVVVGEPVYYAGIVALLLAFRVVWRLRRASPAWRIESQP